MKEIIAITALSYGITTGVWYLYVGHGELEGLKKKITTVLSILNSFIVVIFGGLTLFERSFKEVTKLYYYKGVIKTG